MEIGEIPGEMEESDFLIFRITSMFRKRKSQKSTGLAVEDRILQRKFQHRKNWLQANPN